MPTVRSYPQQGEGIGPAAARSVQLLSGRNTADPPSDASNDSDMEWEANAMAIYDGTIVLQATFHFPPQAAAHTPQIPTGSEQHNEATAGRATLTNIRNTVAEPTPGGQAIAAQCPAARGSTEEPQLETQMHAAEEGQTAAQSELGQTCRGKPQQGDRCHTDQECRDILEGLQEARQREEANAPPCQHCQVGKHGTQLCHSCWAQQEA